MGRDIEREGEKEKEKERRDRDGERNVLELTEEEISAINEEVNTK